MALSRKFHWVEVDRDHDPEIPVRLHVSAYPSLLVLGIGEENIHRFQSFKEPEPFLKELREGLHRYRLYQEGKAWDLPPERPAVLSPEAEDQPWPFPEEGVPSGIVLLGKELLVARGKTLYRLDPGTGKVLGKLELPLAPQDLATDGQRLFAVDGAWTAGSPIRVLDPRTGKILGEIVTEKNLGRKRWTSRGLCWRGGKLYVLEIHGQIHEVDPETGEIGRSMKSGQRWVFGLAHDGKGFVTGGREALFLLDEETGKVRRKIPSNYRLRAVGFDRGRYLAMEQPVFGFDRRHRPIQVFPRPGRTVIHRLVLKKAKEGSKG